MIGNRKTYCGISLTEKCIFISILVGFGLFIGTWINDIGFQSSGLQTQIKRNEHFEETIIQQRDDIQPQPPSSLNDDEEFRTPPITPQETTNRLIYMRIAKTGSSTTRELMETITKQTHAKYVMDVTQRLWHQLNIQSGGDNQEKLLSLLLLEEVSNIKNDGSMNPVLFSGDMSYIDFRRYQTNIRPVYISIARDPFQQLVSLYYYLQRKVGEFKGTVLSKITYDQCVARNLSHCVAANDKGYFRLIHSFCGNDPLCKYQNADALSVAKKNVMRDYAVVGLSEHYTETLHVLEKIFPQYFTGLPDLFKLRNGKKINVNTNKVTPNNTTVTRMKSLLSMEYDFYKFLKQRLFIQYNALVKK